MNSKIFSKIFILLFCSIVFASAIHAQEKPQALKFDEFEEPSESAFTAWGEEISLTQRAERFGEQFRKERGAKAYLIYYLGRITEQNFDRNLNYKIDRIKYNIRAENDYSYENIITINGGYREKTTIEFWIVPKNAELPEPTPTINKSETVVCPNINIYSRTLYDQSGVLDFSISENGLKEIPQYNLKWKFIGGEIINEQGLSEIRIKADDKVKKVTAFLEINNLPFECPRVYSTTAKIEKIHLTDEFGREPNGQIKSRLDAFANTLYNYPAAKGYIINYGSRAEGKKTLIRREKLIMTHFQFRGIDLSKITIVNGGYREVEATELWISFDDNKPIPTPTINEKFVGIPATAKKPIRRKSK